MCCTAYHCPSLVSNLGEEFSVSVEFYQYPIECLFLSNLGKYCTTFHMNVISLCQHDVSHTICQIKADLGTSFDMDKTPISHSGL